ncbi:hypothetical protein DPMN_044639 [Dreissena polymorpha]|uniref:Uncharacterized protein n=1 Tax=Dreissena polymorpha TaxID=45954 RepID=A0A9D4D4W2_DREPO|nr:hypothetical protein DPMN_044639 [Dreissena polymorpha]
MLKLAQTDRQTNRPTDRQGKNNMSPTTIFANHNERSRPPILLDNVCRTCLSVEPWIWNQQKPSGDLMMAEEWLPAKLIKRYANGFEPSPEFSDGRTDGQTVQMLYATLPAA